MISIYLEDQFLTVNNDIFQKNDTMYDMTEIKRWVKAAEIYNKWIKKTTAFLEFISIFQ